MSEGTGTVPENSGRRSAIRGPQDFVGGLVLMLVALFAFWASGDLAGQRGFSFGPGTAPRLFAGLLFLLGAAVALNGLLKDGSPLQRFAIRGPLFVTVAIVFFSFAIRLLGLILSSILDISDRCGRFAGDPMGRGAHCRGAADLGLRVAFPLCARAAVPAACRRSCSEGVMDIFSNLALGFHVVFQFVPWTHHSSAASSTDIVLLVCTMPLRLVPCRNGAEYY